MTTLLTLLFILPLVAIFIWFASGKSFFSDAEMPQDAERKAEIRMAELNWIMSARETIEIAPWFICGSVVLGGCSCFYGLAPVRYLLATAGIGVVWTGIIVLSWRLRNEALKMFALMFVLFGQLILWHPIGGGKSYAIVQGWFVVWAIYSAVAILLRRWLYKFARLEINS